MVKIAQFGTWESPLGAASVAASGGEPKWVDVHGGRVWWAETRPTEAGRVALLHEGPDGHPVEVLPAPWNVRNRVHEYGGRPWTVLDSPGGELVVFTSWADQRLYLLEVGAPSEPRPITPAPDRHHGVRYADLSPGPDGSVLCVRETVTGDGPTDIHRDLVAIPVHGDPDGGGARVLVASHRFMTGPRLSPDGTRVAWIGWDHPRMPWDGAELCVAPLAGPGAYEVLAGGPRESPCQVEWESPESLLALSDPDGWWNLFRIGLDGSRRNLAPCAEELGGPLWTVGARWFATLGDGRYAILRSGRLAVLDENAATVTDVDTDRTMWTPDVAVLDGAIVSAAGGPTRDLAVVKLAGGALTTLTAERTGLPDETYLPVPEERLFAGPDGRQVPALVYPPTNPDFAGPDGAAPPYLVYVHGGPTGKVRGTLNLEIAYFTSRGFGYAAVNYGGSAGYGREFRESLNGEWGVVDVHDCAAVATALAEEGSADGTRLAIRGGSAGGWTSAASMTTVDTYRCATIMYPLLDLLGFADETHDFESRYLDGLVGTLPEHEARYIERSPMNRLDRLAGPVLLLQGLEDQVCPPEQANRYVAALDGSGVPHAYLTFEGEQHGFRRADTVTAALEAELSFYGQVFGFATPGVPVVELRR
ncbi:MAG: prolyl oligopeptidase family serine peptidase [Actinophytocola sp.]|uniref:dipeptidyl-peptidase 5 n=1 Tax=Actinophytocola sp. TaxID=1872138 RepID=UPI0013215155|nr:prolyl oligopeptidase family serine peptidase [Actinophytocola sp.]MPZ80636.1 prolyl oligopeptidase family serine peptidase [Actinophytocola sp.]